MCGGCEAVQKMGRRCCGDGGGRRQPATAETLWQQIEEEDGKEACRWRNNRRLAVVVSDFLYLISFDFMKQIVGFNISINSHEPPFETAVGNLPLF
jgi:hypothetical protein